MFSIGTDVFVHVHFCFVLIIVMYYILSNIVLITIIIKVTQRQRHKTNIYCSQLVLLHQGKYKIKMIASKFARQMSLNDMSMTNVPCKINHD